MKKLPSLYQWKQFFKILNKKEKIAFFVFLILFLSSSIFLIFNFYFENTKIGPIHGGVHIEGVIGQPSIFINPIGPFNDVDQDLVELIFSGLMKYDPVKGLIPDLAKNYNIGEDGTYYEFYLREDVFWHDGKQFSADDVVFTIKTIQNPNFESPLIAAWAGVEVEKIDQFKVRFVLPQPNILFLENATVKILPKHIWKDIDYSNFPLHFINLQPIGTGPFKFKKIIYNQAGYVESLKLEANHYYHHGRPYLSQIIFRFFQNEEQLVEAIQKNEITGFSTSSPLINYDFLKKHFNIFYFSFLRYFAVFFNLEQTELLKEKSIRQALNYATNKKIFVEQILNNKGKVINSPILSEILVNLPVPLKIYEFNLEKAKNLLKELNFYDKDQDGFREKIIRKEPDFQFKSDLRRGSRGKEVRKLQKCLAEIPNVYPEGIISGYFGAKTKMAVIRFQEKYKQEILIPHGLKRGTGMVGASTRAKLNEICIKVPKEIIPLEFSLVTANQPLLIKTAELLKKQWQKIGVNLKIEIFDINKLKENFIKPRNYEILIFGQILNLTPDLLSFWHSGQKRYPGLNLSGYENPKVDRLLQEIRRTLDPKIRYEKYKSLQDILIKDAPAVFLFSPNYLYVVSPEIKRIEAKIITCFSQRFHNIEEWYIKTGRVWK